MKVSQKEYKILLNSLCSFIGRKKYLNKKNKDAIIAEKFLDKIEDEYQNNITMKWLKKKNEEEYKKSTLGACKDSSCD